ncbi:MAG: DUF4168 domain-containing protein [Candidatus Binataceae bacterium]
MTLSRKILARIGAGSLAMLLAMPISSVMAQSAPAGDSGYSTSSPSASGAVDDATLKKAAQAYVKVKKIVHNEKQSANDPNAGNPQHEASQKLDAVRSTGLQPDQYNHVIQIVENDPGLMQKFQTYVNQNGGDVD